MTKLLHCEKADLGIEVTLLSLTEAKFSHILKSRGSIEVIFGGISMNCKFEQWKKAACPIDTRLEGNFISSNPEQLKNE